MAASKTSGRSWNPPSDEQWQDAEERSGMSAGDLEGDGGPGET
jgi:hypothetical protein